MSLDIPRIRALCFDIDGTLSDTDDQFVHKLARLLRPFRPLLKAKTKPKPPAGSSWLPRRPATG